MQDARANAGLCAAARRVAADPAQNVCPAAHRRHRCNRWWLSQRRRRMRRPSRRRKCVHEGPCSALRLGQAYPGWVPSCHWCNGEAAWVSEAPYLTGISSSAGSSKLLWKRKGTEQPCKLKRVKQRALQQGEGRIPILCMVHS